MRMMLLQGAQKQQLPPSPPQSPQQKQLTSPAASQLQLLNVWTKAMARRLQEGPPSSPLTLAAAEAPFADPFLIEFEDPETLNKAYQETPMTFEQALMTARLEAKMATQVCQLSPYLTPDSLKREVHSADPLRLAEKRTGHPQERLRQARWMDPKCLQILRCLAAGTVPCDLLSGAAALCSSWP